MAFFQQMFQQPAIPVPNWIDTANTNIQSLIGSPCPRFTPDQNERNYITVYNIFKPLIFQVYSIVNDGTELERKQLLSSLYDNFNRNITIAENAIHSGLIPNNDPSISKDQYITTWYNDIFGDASRGNECSLVVQGGEGVNMYSVFRHENVPTHDTDTRLLAGNHFNYHTRIADVDLNIKLRMHRYRFIITMGFVVLVHTFITTIINERNAGQMGTCRQYVNSFPRYNNNEAWDIVLARSIANPVTITIGGTDLLPTLNQPKPNPSPHFPNYQQGRVYYLPQMNDPPQRYNLTDNQLEQLTGAHINIINLDGSVTPFPIIDLYLPRLTTCNTHENCVGHNQLIHSFFQTEQTQSCTDNNQRFLTRNGSVPSITHTYTNPIDRTNLKLRIVPHGYLFWDTLRMLLVSQSLQQNHRTNKVMKYKQKINCLLSTTFRGDISHEILNICTTNKVYTAQRPANHLMGGRIQLNQMNQNESTPNFLEESPSFPKQYEEMNNHVSLSSTQQYNEDYTESGIHSGENESELKYPEPKVSEPEYTEQFIRGARAFIRKIIQSGVPFEEVDTTKFTNEMEWAGYMEWMSYIYGGFSDYRLPPLPDDSLFPIVKNFIPTPSNSAKWGQQTSTLNKKSKIQRKLNQTRSAQPPRQQSSSQLQRFRRSRRKANRR